MTPQITVIGRERDRLGESPVWDPDLQRLFWVDSVGPALRSLDPRTGEQLRIAAPDVLGSVVLGDPGRLVAGMRHGVARIDVDIGAFTPLLHLNGLQEGERLNDGKADRRGAFVTGTLFHAGADRPDGKLFRLAAGRPPQVLERGIEISNSICFSPLGDRLYFSDSLRMAIWRYDYEAETGAIGPRETFVSTAELGSAPDGATVDEGGRVWVALVQAGRLACFEPDGKLAALVDMPVPLPSCPAFGGPGMDVLFVTTIRDSGGRLKSDHLQAGRLLAIEGLGVRGLPETRCRL